MITDVAIIGSGYTALSTAYHLNKLGPVKAVLINDGIDQSHEIRQSEHAVISTYFDQVTRIVNAFGREDAEKMISFSNEAYRYLKNFCEQKEIGIRTNPIKRIGAGDMENKELNEVNEIFSSFGYKTTKIAWKGLDFYFTGEESASLSSRRFLNFQKEGTNTKTVSDKVIALEELDGSIIIKLENGSIIKSEMVVLANHEKISDLIPFYKNVLIPYTDQWNKAVTNKPFLKVGEMAMWKYSNVWAKALNEYEIVFGGARFLRKNPQELSKLAIEPKVSAYISNNLSRMFDVKIGEVTTSTPFLGIRCCDEKPIIGPHFGSGKILIGSGYMGNPISFGFYAGKCLSEVIINGHSDALPYIFRPERLRSLARND